MGLSMRGVTLAISLACLVGVRTAAPQAAPTEKSDTTLHAKAQLVEVDVVVTDGRGNPVRGLQASDFSVFEDKAQQTISSFDEHSGSNASALASALPAGVFSNGLPLPDGAPVDVLLLDSLNTPQESQPYLRDQLVSYIDHAKPGTRLAIFVLNTRLRMLQGLTSDPALLKMALIREGVKFSPLLKKDINDSTTHDMSKSMSDIITAAPMENPVLENIQTMMLNTDARTSSEKTQVRVRLSLDALDELARYLAGIPGRKNLIWFSGAFPTAILRDAQTTGNKFAGNANMEDEVRKTLALMTRSRVAISPVDARGLMAPPSAGASEQSASPTNASLTYGTPTANPVDSQYFHDMAGDHETMQVMADITGGMALFNTNGLSGAMDTVTNAAHSYYTLSYTPPVSGRAGTQREIAVKLKQSGLHLAYRHEYFTDSTTYQPGNPGSMPPGGGSSAVVQAAMAPHTQDATEVLFEVAPRVVASGASDAAADGAPGVKWVGESAFQGVPHARYVTTLNVDAKTVSFTESADGKVHGVIDFILIVYDDKGKQIDSKLDRAVLALEPAHYQKFLTEGMKFRFNLVLPSVGDEVVHFGVHDAVTDRIGTLELSAAAIRGSGEMAAQ
jgi:VWFA-related protein